MSVLYEKGTPAWDIGHLLTVHNALQAPLCAVVIELRRNQFAANAHTGHRYTPEERLAAARETPCTCHRG